MPKQSKNQYLNGDIKARDVLEFQLETKYFLFQEDNYDQILTEMRFVLEIETYY